MINSEKSEIRKKYKQIRNAIADRTDKEKTIADNVSSFMPFKNADIIFAYAATGSEVNIDSLIFYALSVGKKVALPVCNDNNGNMEFYLVNDESDLKVGMFSIREPVKEKCEKARFTEKSLCLVPGVCFDMQGGRLGYGKGYYDRFLECFKGTTVGISFQECIAEKLCLDKYDKKVTYLITDKNIYNFSE